MIAVDAMGGDYAPQEAVKGSLAAAKGGIPLILFGKEDVIKALLNDYDPQWSSLPIQVVNCADAVDMADDPVRAILRKKDSSIISGLTAVKAGTAHAFVSAGNSGAVMAAASVVVGRVSGVLRPAIGSFLPTHTGSFFCLDLGANPDCTEDNVMQFAYMGYAYVRLIKEIGNPTVALLSNGHEPSKGSSLAKRSFELLSKTKLNFIGNIESRDIFSGTADIVVTDGFTGNVLLKGIQGTANAILYWMKQEAYQSLWSRIFLFFSWPLLSRIKKRIDYARTGGALLLGINKPVVIAHGSSKAEAITQAIKFAHKTVERNVVPAFNETLQSLICTTKSSLAGFSKPVYHQPHN